MALSCKYCGTECHNSGSVLMGKNGSTCSSSPTKKHVLVPTGSECVYCGTETHNSGSVLMGKNGSTCSNSPSKKHQLSD
jgi:hypothetical protein